MLSRYDAVLCALDAGVVIHAADTRILEANDRARALLGIPDLEDRPAGDPVWAFLESDGSPMALERYPVMQVLASGEPVRGLIMIVRTPRGHDVHLEVNAIPIIDDAGRVDQVAVTFIDVSDRLRAVTELARAEEESWMAFELSGIATCLVANDDRIIRVNEAMCELLVRTEAELLTLTPLELTHPDDRPASAQRIRDLATGRAPHIRVTKRYLTGDGRVVWGDVTVSTVLTEDGRLRHRIAQIVDVTAEHTLRESLLEAQRIAHLGSWTLDLTTNHVTGSEELFLMQGGQPPDSPRDYTRYSEVFTPASWQELRTAISITTQTGVPYELELETVRPDGVHGWMLVQGEAVRDADGTIVALRGTALDITERKTAQQALAASEELMRVVLDTTSDAVVRIDRDGRIQYANAQVERNSSIALTQWIGRTFTEMGYGELARSWEEHDRKVFDTGEPLTFEFEIDNTQGHRWYETTVTPEFGADGTVATIVQTSRDVTERKESEIALRETQEQLERAQRIAHVGSWTLDLATGEVAWSRELHLIWGRNPDDGELNFSEFNRLLTSESWLRMSAAIAHTRQTGTGYEVELEIVRPDGTHGWILARGEAVYDPTGAVTGLRGVAMDITEAKAANEALQKLATRDPLTGLANRAALLDEITRAVSAGQRSGRATGVLMMDLDHFKNVNDTLGHGIGDELLVAASRRVEEAVRAGDLVARIGGDEFVVVMRDLADPGEAVRAAERVLAEFRTPFTPGDAELFTTASIGVAIATEASDANDLVREADTAMYAAKDAGRDRISVFNEDLRATVSARLAVERDLRRALERGQLAVWYQPEVDLGTGEVVAFEALLRWHHPDGSVWTADRFIDVAEDTGLILDIGDWVMRQACAHAAAWATSRPTTPIRVWVNTSALQLAEAGLMEAIDVGLAASGLDPALLGIEITETALLRQTSTAQDNLTSLRERRIKIAIDDFGTGYASLTYLRRYPIDLIKIDRSFIAGLTINDHDREITAGIIALADALGIAVTAEGVEHREQAALLLQLGCPSAQGWLYSRAVPAEEVIPLLGRGPLANASSTGVRHGI